ncbi:DedA family protein [Romeriopsis navalis]|uniref:DedA family protein n=1 Tax=Romeriopsis navalis TaxID=2992132 RepID=UPI0021F85F8B|nr:DedA family protein [Romeriopsis navalis]
MEFISIETIQDFAQDYGYWAIFWGILLENIGLPIPGETVTIVGGFLAGSEKLSYGLVLTDATLGATIGGHLGYWLGRLGGYQLLVRLSRFLRLQESQIADLRDQFSQNGAKAVFIGRFIALLRVFASPLAGIAEMPYLKFTLYNSLGAFAWAATMVSLSFFAGELVPLERLIQLASQFSLVALTLVGLSIGIPFYLENRKKPQPITTIKHPTQTSTSATATATEK